MVAEISLKIWKRGFIEIISDILECLTESQLKKTHIMYRCNLDHRVIKKYLLVVESLGLVQKSNEDRTLYVITQKGLQYRHEFKSFFAMIENDLENISNQQKVPTDKISDKLVVSV